MKISKMLDKAFFYLVLVGLTALCIWIMLQ